MRSTFFEKKVEPKNFTYKGAVKGEARPVFSKLKTFQKNALTDVSVLIGFRTQDI